MYRSDTIHTTFQKTGRTCIVLTQYLQHSERQEEYASFRHNTYADLDFSFAHIQITFIINKNTLQRKSLTGGV